MHAVVSHFKIQDYTTFGLCSLRYCTVYSIYQCCGDRANFVSLGRSLESRSRNAEKKTLIIVLMINLCAFYEAKYDIKNRFVLTINFSDLKMTNFCVWSQPESLEAAHLMPRVYSRTVI